MASGEEGTELKARQRRATEISKYNKVKHAAEVQPIRRIRRLHCNMRPQEFIATRSHQTTSEGKVVEGERDSERARALHQALASKHESDRERDRKRGRERVKGPIGKKTTGEYRLPYCQHTSCG